MRNIVFCLVCSLTANAINSPQIRSVLVLPNGNTTVYWQIPSDPFNEFKSYEVFYSPTLAGPYTNMASISSYTTFSSTCFSCNANNQSYYFYVQVKTQSNVIVPALDTVKSIFLVLNSPPYSQYAKLQWNDFLFPLPAGEGSVYKVFKEYPIPNNWTQIATVPVNTSSVSAYYYFTDTISVCQDSISYRVELSDPVLGYSSVSNIKGTQFMDKNPPATPSLDSVSVDANGHAILGISASYSGDVKCFIIYKYTSGTYVAIDTLCTNNVAVVYTYSASVAGNGSEEFSVAALDSCNNISQIALNSQNTMYLQVTYDVCGKTASLNWNPYKNMKGGVDHYEILCSINGGPFNHLADTTGLSYKHKALITGTNYCYLVRAHNPQKTVSSTSNKFCIVPAPALLPAYAYMKKVTVSNPSERIYSEWYVDNTVKLGGFEVYRSGSFSGPFGKVGTVISTGANTYGFTDNYADASQSVFFYKVLLLDTCMIPVLTTDTANSIHLSAVASGNFTATLNWNVYNKWLGNVSGYNIYRSLDGYFPSVPTATVGPGTTTYVDDLSNYTTYSGKFSYYVEAVEGPGNPYGFTETSQSNQADVYVDASLFVPNAFVPKGYNKIFIPVADYIEKTDYKFSIFDRWGTKIFETADVTQGWDGDKYEEGVYAYLIQYKTAIGEYREQRGTVTLIR